MEHTIYDSSDTDSNYWYEDEKVNLNTVLDGVILVIADLGLWDGHHSGYKILGSNLSGILNVGQGDCFKVYYDSETGDVKATDTHHDGTNTYTFREVRKGVNITRLTDKIYDGSHTEDDIAKYTKSLGKYVCKIYGWKKDRAARKAA